MRIALQQRHRFYREGLADLLAGESDLRVVGAVESPTELVSLCDSTKPDAAILEWEAREVAPRPAARQLLARCPGLRLVVLRDPTAPDPAAVAAWPGAVVVPRAAGVAGVLHALRASSHTRSRVDRHETTAEPTRLTPRERAILTLIATGATSQEAATRLGISQKTVENYKQRMFVKLAVQNQAHAVAVAIRCGMLMPEPIVDAAAS